MLIRWNDPCVRLTGRWSRREKPHNDPRQFAGPPCECAATTAPGSSFELGFTGRFATLRFQIDDLTPPPIHLWVQVDGGARVEAPLSRFLRVDAGCEGAHVVRVIFKSAWEILHRWHLPLTGCVAFIGAEAEGPAALPEDDRPLVEFVGDSITEGVLVDEDIVAQDPAYLDDRKQRQWQDDVCGTYAWQAAEKLNLRCMFQAYGAVGTTRTGNGGVPRAGMIYPYVFENEPYTGEKPFAVVINHGTNDRAQSAEEFIQRYQEYLDVIREQNPQAKIVCIAPFVGCYHEELKAIVAGRQAKGEPIYYVETEGWLEPEPLHPLRSAHSLAAEKLAPILKEIFAQG